MLIAMGQMCVEGGDRDKNLERAASMIHQAAEESADIVLLPECLDLGWTDSSALTLAEPIPGRSSARLAEAAAKEQIYVVAGLVERDRAGLYNAAVVISPTGDILTKHRKINELAIAHHLYQTGDRLGVVPTPLGTLGIDICADNAPGSLVVGHVLGRMGAQILLSPSAWAVPADHDPVREPYGGMWLEQYRRLAQWYAMPVIGVSNVGWLRDGPWKGWQCIGHSLAVDAKGGVAATGTHGVDASECRVVDIELVPRRLTGTSLVEDLRARGYRE